MKKLFCAVMGVVMSASIAIAGFGGTSSSSYSSVSSYYKIADRFKEIHELIDQNKFGNAHIKLKAMPVKSDEADRLNLLGFTARKLGILNGAANFYELALETHPKHKNAFAYQGELYIQLGQLGNAKVNLAKLEKNCWIPCSTESELRKSITDTLMN